MDPRMTANLLALHADACSKQQRTYKDPATGFAVLTEYAHRVRGQCCGNACRHCPWDWQNVDEERFDGVAEAREQRRQRRNDGGL